MWICSLKPHLPRSKEILSCTQPFQGPSFLPYSAEIFWRCLMLFLKWKWRAETTAHHSGSMPNPLGFTGPCCAQSSWEDMKVPSVKVLYWCQHHFGLLEVHAMASHRAHEEEGELRNMWPEVKCKKADFSIGIIHLQSRTLLPRASSPATGFLGLRHLVPAQTLSRP